MLLLLGMNEYLNTSAMEWCLIQVVFLSRFQCLDQDTEVTEAELTNTITEKTFCFHLS